MQTRFSRKLLIAAMAATVSGHATAQFNYSEPTRGFMMERAYTAENRKAAVDIASGGAQDLATGIRLGLPGSELMLNHARLDPRGTMNEALLKVGLAPFHLDQLQVDWSVYGGISHFDPDEGDSNTNLGFGAALTTDINNFLLNFSPEIIFDDGAEDDASDVFVNLGFGAHYNLPETNIGRFQPGIEFNLTTRDTATGESADPSLMLGTRWLYNDHVTLDLVLLNFGSNVDEVTGDGQDQVSIPGFVRLNVAF